MSNPVTNVEIEDVLSSIRKLVAEEVRATPVARKPEKTSRLILTAAQRVRDDTPEPSPAPEPVLLTQPILPQDDPAEELAIDDIPGDARLADFGAVEGAFPDIDEVETRDTQDDTSEQPSDVWDDAQSHEDVVAQDTAHDASGSMDPRSELSRLIEEEVSAALALSQDEDDDSSNAEEPQGWHDDPDEKWSIEEDGPSDHDDAVTPHDDAALQADDPEAWEDDAAWHDIEEAARVDGGDSAPASEEGHASPALLTLEDKVAALGRLVARDSQEFEEERDRPDADELSAIAEPMTWPDAPFEEVEEEEPASHDSNVLHAQDAWPQQNSYDAPDPVAEQVDTAALQTVDMDDHAALEIDEETLRLMVVEIVRQELQGALGERITRNVRKLVRREIHRMLISQELD
jgi:hypothetical protein